MICDVEGLFMGVRGERLIGCGGIVGEKVGGELTPESSLMLLILFFGRTAGAEDRGTIGKGIESSITVSFGSFSCCTRRSMNLS